MLWIRYTCEGPREASNNPGKYVFQTVNLTINLQKNLYYVMGVDEEGGITANKHEKSLCNNGNVLKFHMVIVSKFC